MRNLEVKARCADLDAVRAQAELDSVASALGLRPDDFVSGAYVDLRQGGG